MLCLLIHRDMLHLLLKTADHYFIKIGQEFLRNFYLALLSTMYYGLFRIGELTMSQHTVKARDVHIGINKKKMLFLLRSLKTHAEDSLPQLKSPAKNS